MLESTQQIKKINLDYCVINYQWFRVAYIILCKLQNTNSQILPTKTRPGNRILIIKNTKRKEKERKKIENIFASIY